jgi:hypothetical protein
LLVIFEEFSFQFCTNVGRVSTNSTNRISAFGTEGVAAAAPRLCRVSRRARPPRGRGAAEPRRIRGRAAAQPISATAARRGGIQQPRLRGQPARSEATGGPAWGAEQRRWVGGAEAGPTD